ncbi:uncharacterized protein LOC107042432 [Diachasma alloeum]|uniref:uncharacterized protein LOC107042432 n=1 Tax=Diachasma alloeum TaxID=454923 RepID=UPI00073810F3|nr:uncharacterized protein LOC107042432 [Diachasma alloeum]
MASTGGDNPEGNHDVLHGGGDEEKQRRDQVPPTTSRTESKAPLTPSEMMIARLGVQYSRQAYLERGLARLRNTRVEDLTEEELNSMEKIADKHFEHFNTYYNTFQNAPTEEFLDSDYYKEDVHGLTMTIHSDIITIIGRLRGEIKRSRSSTSTDNNRGNLSRIALPTFDGRYEAWKPYEDLFNSMVRLVKGIPSVEKMVRLNGSLKGEPLNMISNLTVTDDNFEIAWNKLVKHYDNRRLIIAAHIDKILELKPVVDDPAKGLSNLSNIITQALDALRALDAPVDHWDLIVGRIARRCIDLDTKKAWEVHLGGSRDPPTLRELLDFIEARARALENVAHDKPAQTSKDSSSKFKGKHQQFKVHHASAAGGQAKAPAEVSKSGVKESRLCGGDHWLGFNCESFRAKTPTERREIVIAKNLCYNSLGPHRAPTCTTKERCKVKDCNGNHHTLIHEGSPEYRRELQQQTQLSQSSSGSSLTNPRELATPSSSTGPVEQSADSKVIHQTSTSEQRVVLLATAKALAASSFGTYHHVRLLIDQGSEVTFITEKLVNILQLRRKSTNIKIFGIGGLESGSTRGAVKVNLHSRFNHQNQVEVTAHILTKLTSTLPSIHCTKAELNHLQGLQLADNNFLKPGSIDIIIGADHYGQIIGNNISKSSDNQTVVQQTIFGWIISGTVCCTSCQPKTSLTAARESSSEQLLDLLKRFWVQEEPPSHENMELGPEELECEEHFQRTHTRESSGRYVVRLPLKTSPSALGQSRKHALQLLNRTSTKLSSNPSYGKLYKDFINEYEALGHIKRVSEASEPSPVFYLPHHGVLREDSITTKLRVVFNGSSKTSSGVSLNEILHSGGKLQVEGSDVLIWLRTHRWVVGPDIVKMFRQINVNEEDWDLQRILWRVDDNNLITYQLTTELHLTSSPPRTVEFENSTVKVLGLFWNPISDVFTYKAKEKSKATINKRNVLSEIAQLYDPLGLIGPVIIRAKIFIQELWLLKIGWDDPLPMSHIKRWNEFREEFTQLGQIQIPRWLQTSSTSSSIQIHRLADASNLAMGAAVYIRVDNHGLEPSIILVCAKTKVAPLKKITISRLELLAAVLLSNLVTYVQRGLGREDLSLFLWSDSTTALTWINGHPSRWKDFIQNRVIKIQNSLPSAAWRHISGKDNPADCASRGLSPSQLVDHQLWWNGPPWLKSPQEEWPSSSTVMESTTEAALEERPVLAHPVAHVQQPQDLLERYSTFNKVLRVSARVMRAIKLMRHQEVPDSPVLLLDDVRIYWIKLTQNEHFEALINLLKNGREIWHNHPLEKLTPWLDEDQMLRLGGRLRRTHLEPDAMTPAIISRQSRLTSLVIEEAHRKTLHGGVQLTLAYIRQRDWIVEGRQPVKSHILKCIICARHRAIRAQQLMGQLPPRRITPARPFLHTGVDFAGPVKLLRWRGSGAKQYQGYIAVFVCLVTSAIHLEPVTDLTKEAFIETFKRFTGRRGICATLSCDNALTFVGAEKELGRLFNRASAELHHVANVLASDGTKWTFIPPASPHYGGKWEAAVKSLKHHLKRITNNLALTFEELITVLIQIEAQLNSRRLCPLSDDPEDCRALTPGHFIIGDAINAVSEPSLLGERLDGHQRWKIFTQWVQDFWDRWYRECIHRFQTTSKWRHQTEGIKVGDLVLMVNERFPPTKWPMGRVTRIHPSTDGLPRVVDFITRGGPTPSTFTRHINRLVPLHSRHRRRSRG